MAEHVPLELYDFDAEITAIPFSGASGRPQAVRATRWTGRHCTGCLIAPRPEVVGSTAKWFEPMGDGDGSLSGTSQKTASM